MSLNEFAFVRAASIDDIEAIMDLNNELEFDKWSIEQYKLALEHQLGFDLCVIDNLVVGVVIYSQCFDELKILLLIVAKNFQKQYIASTLLYNTINTCQKLNDISYVMLDVCISNLAAVSLYHKFGFRILCVRSGYYEDGFIRDGYLMQLKLSDFTCIKSN